MFFSLLTSFLVAKLAFTHQFLG